MTGANDQERVQQVLEGLTRTEPSIGTSGAPGD